MKIPLLLGVLSLFLQLYAAVSLNNATLEELCSLKGIGEQTAHKIIEYRKEHGFKRVDEVMNIRGIGEKKFDKIKAELTL